MLYFTSLAPSSLGDSNEQQERSKVRSSFDEIVVNADRDCRSESKWNDHSDQADRYGRLVIAPKDSKVGFHAD